MITIFTSARPFTDPFIALIQRNAIASWFTSFPGCEIIIVGDEPGVAEIAQEFHLTHIPNVEKNALGKPLRSAVFRVACERARTPLMCFISADIILMSDFLPAIKQVTLPNFLLVGRRYDLDITAPIDFEQPQWETKLRTRIAREGELHGPSAVDYAVFRKELPQQMLPPLSMNHGGWDNWFIYQHVMAAIPVIDGSAAITVVHQNHDNPTQSKTKKNLWQANTLAREELRRAGGFSHMLTLWEANYLLTDEGLRRPSFPRSIRASLGRFAVYQRFFGVKRWLQHSLL